MNFLHQQCTKVDNTSSVPEKISFGTKKTLPTFEIRNDDIIMFIRSLDSNKALSQVEYQFVCENYVLLPYLNHYKFFTKTVWIMNAFFKRVR